MWLAQVTSPTKISVFSSAEWSLSFLYPLLWRTNEVKIVKPLLICKPIWVHRLVIWGSQSTLKRPSGQGDEKARGEGYVEWRGEETGYCPFLHSGMQQILTEHPLSAKHCATCWGGSYHPCLHGTQQFSWKSRIFLNNLCLKRSWNCSSDCSGGALVGQGTFSADLARIHSYLFSSLCQSQFSEQQGRASASGFQCGDWKDHSKSCQVMAMVSESGALTHNELGCQI